jgi:hypothetical protein
MEGVELEARGYVIAVHAEIAELGAPVERAATVESPAWRRYLDRLTEVPGPV